MIAWMANPIAIKIIAKILMILLEQTWLLQVFFFLNELIGFNVAHWILRSWHVAFKHRFNKKPFNLKFTIDTQETKKRELPSITNYPLRLWRLQRPSRGGSNDAKTKASKKEKWIGKFGNKTGCRQYDQTFTSIFLIARKF